MKAFTERDYIRERKKLKRTLKKAQTIFEQKDTRLASRFVKTHCSLIPLKVYIPVDNVKAKRDYKRFVIYIYRVKFFDDHPMIVVGGWWIHNKTNRAEKWDVQPIWGVGNSAVFELAEDQTYTPPTKPKGIR